MHGTMWSYRGGFTGNIPELRAAPGGDYLGNFRHKGAPRRGERVEQWIKRVITDQLVNTVPNGWGNGPWWKDREFVVSVRWLEHGAYHVNVTPYVVDLVKH
jgi:hypothetical protein